MDELNKITETLALSMGASWASGINLYAAVATLGFLAMTGNIELPEGLKLLENPLVFGAALLMFAVEFFVDKVPGADTAWDGLHTFIRIPAGALLAAGAVGDMNPGVQLAAAILGGGLTASTHAAKAGSRALINTSPEPFSNWTVSLTEDAAVIAGLWVALNHPTLFLALLILFIILMIWLLPKVWRGIKKVFGRLKRKLAPKNENKTAGGS